MIMIHTAYLEGANPYPEGIIKEYTAKGWWLDLTYGDVLDRAAERYPDKMAVIDDRTSLTYQELKERVDRLAIAFLRMGITKFDRIIFQLPNRHEFLLAFYAAQRIGAVPVITVARSGYQEISHFFNLTGAVGWVVPLQDGKHEYTTLREEIREEAKSLKYLIMPDEGEQMPEAGLSISALIEAVSPDQHPPDYLARYRPDPNDVAIILTTGGTTGLPKGVPRTHNSFLSNVRYTGLETLPEDVRAQVTPIGHTMAHQGAVGAAIFYGNTLVLISSPKAVSILEAIHKYRVTHIGMVPTQLEDLLNYPDLVKYDLTSIKHMRTAGAALRPETADRASSLLAAWGGKFGGGAFGSTEGPNARQRAEAPPTPRGSIGMPGVDGDHWKAIDDDERELPPDTEGELVAKGPAVFTGYYRSEEENRIIFTRDGYYKMGDLGRIDEQGFIFITGRKKDIIQRGGEGIIPKLIEDLLDRLPAVEKSVVAMPDPRLGEKACAYVVLKPGAALTFEDMVSGLKAMRAGVLLLPERLEITTELARTAIGKIDKKALQKDITEKLERESAAG
jgi:non-ribosomal peptide synthetase component E (peptide arylation enzyme)